MQLSHYIKTTSACSFFLIMMLFISFVDLSISVGRQYFGKGLRYCYNRFLLAHQKDTNVLLLIILFLLKSIPSLYYWVKAKIFKKKLDKNNSIPNTYQQVLKCPNVKEWLIAIFNEFEQLISLKTLKFLPYKVLFKGRKPLTNRLVFKEKKDQYDVTIKFKTRLVVKGFMQIKRIDYFETFAFIIISLSWRILFAITVIYDWEVE